jgi:hypothetical protein
MSFDMAVICQKRSFLARLAQSPESAPSGASKPRFKTARSVPQLAHDLQRVALAVAAVGAHEPGHEIAQKRRRRVSLPEPGRIDRAAMSTVPARSFEHVPVAQPGKRQRIARPEPIVRALFHIWEHTSRRHAQP